MVLKDNSLHSSDLMNNLYRLGITADPDAMPYSAMSQLIYCIFYCSVNSVKGYVKHVKTKHPDWVCRQYVTYRQIFLKLLKNISDQISP